METVAGETLEPHRISETSWILLVETPDGALPPAVALDHLGREGRAPELRHVELDLAAGRRQAAPVVARAVGLPLVGAFVATGVRDLVGFRVQQRVEGVLDGLPYELPEVLL